MTASKVPGETGLKALASTKLWWVTKSIISSRPIAYEGLTKMDLERVSSMKVEELKNCLRLRGLKVSGMKERLVARAFVAVENEQIERDLPERGVEVQL